jgi:predicted lysophospholipase L1 biosynthesis ABC-type transport system permease subunit
MSKATAGSVPIQKLKMPPWRQAARTSMKSISVRIGRAIITSSGIFLGVAFLSAVLTSSAVLSSEYVAKKFSISLGPADQVRNIWLVVISLLVATVGIINAMLMAVTERYKEIGTMKCLGALDSFIVRLFLLESGFLGSLGALAGALVGWGLMSLFYAARFGWAVFGHLGYAMKIFGRGVPLSVAIVASIILGGALSVLAALYPSWRAAKMPPAAALRVEI